MRYSSPHGPPSKAAAIGKGAAIGFLVGIASIAAQDNGVNHLLLVLSKPVAWVTWAAQELLGLSAGSAALLGWFGMGIWGMILGALLGWGVSALYAKLTGEE